jgi:hypothetical protein
MSFEKRVHKKFTQRFCGEKFFFPIYAPAPTVGSVVVQVESLFLGFLRLVAVMGAFGLR